jgi:hypothetical protein
LAEDEEKVKSLIADFNIDLKTGDFKMDVKPMLHIVLSSFLGNSAALVDLFESCLPCPLDGASSKVNSISNFRLI